MALRPLSVVDLRTLQQGVVAAVCSSRIVAGSSPATRADLVLVTLRMALSLGRTTPASFINGDAGSLVHNVRLEQVLDDLHVLGSIGPGGDAYSHALAESFVGTFRTETELITDRVWRTRTHWRSRGLHESPGDITPRVRDSELEQYGPSLALSIKSGNQLTGSWNPPGPVVSPHNVRHEHGGVRLRDDDPKPLRSRDNP